MNLLDVQIKIVDNRLKENPDFLPKRHSEGAGAIDLRSINIFEKKEDGTPNFKIKRAFDKVVIEAGKVEFFGTGLAIFIGNSNFVGNVIPRSSAGVKKYMLANTHGYIDSDYQGEIITGIRNMGDSDLIIEFGERLTQYFITPIYTPVFDYVDEFKSVTDRGHGGFGSTGTK